MKSAILCRVAVCLAVIMLSCQTVKPIMVRSSYENNLREGVQGFDYDYYDSRRDNQRLRDKTPDWYGSNWRKWKASQEEDGKFSYVLGISAPKIEDLEKIKSVTYWSLEAANEEARVWAMKELAPSIWAHVVDTVSSNEVQTGVGDNAKLDAKYGANTTITSAASFRGLEVYERFIQTWEMPAKQGGTKTAIYCWIVYRISQAAKEEAGKRMLEDYNMAKDEKLKQQILGDREAAYFKELSLNYEKIGRLTEEELAQNENQFMKKYNQILDIYTEIQTLSLVEGRDDVGQDYKKLKEEMGKELTKYDPLDRQLRLIESLHRQIADKERQIADKDGRIDELRRTKAGYNIQTNATIVAFPQKPSEIRVAPANIFAAHNMVTNRDYISFATINGINNLSRGERGLEAPAVLVAWNDAARYCNWLSRLYGYTPCYTESGGQITGYDKSQNGYRLPEYNEIAAALEARPGVINEREFTQIAIWSSEGAVAQPKFYILSSGTDAAGNRLMEQSVSGASPDMEIGFRVVRNAE